MSRTCHFEGLHCVVILDRFQKHCSMTSVSKVGGDGRKCIVKKWDKLRHPRSRREFYIRHQRYFASRLTHWPQTTQLFKQAYEHQLTSCPDDPDVPCTYSNTLSDLKHTTFWFLPYQVWWPRETCWNYTIGLDLLRLHLLDNFLNCSLNTWKSLASNNWGQNIRKIE